MCATGKIKQSASVVIGCILGVTLLLPGCGGGNEGSFAVQDLSLTPGTVTVIRGGPAQSVKLNRLSGIPGVNASVDVFTNVPAQLTLGPSECLIAPAGSCNFQVSASSSAALGTYTVNFHSNELGASAELKVTVTDPGASTFTFVDIAHDLDAVFGRSRVVNESRALGANDAGIVVGVRETSSGNHWFLWKNGTAFDMGPGKANAVNRDGWVTGTRPIDIPNPLDPGGPPAKVLHAFLWRPSVPNGTSGSFADIGTLDPPGNVPFPTSEGFAINDSGQIAGTASKDGINHAFRYSSGTMTDLGGTPESAGLSINQSGQVAGYTLSGGGSTFHAALWSPSGALMDLHVPAFGNYSSGRSINNAGQVAIASIDSFDQYVGHIWQSGQPLVALLRAGTTTLSADPLCINNSGIVAAYGSRSPWGFYPGAYASGGTIPINGLPSTITDLVPDFLTDGLRVAGHYDTGIGVPKACLLIP